MHNNHVQNVIKERPEEDRIQYFHETFIYSIKRSYTSFHINYSSVAIILPNMFLKSISIPQIIYECVECPKKLLFYSM